MHQARPFSQSPSEERANAASHGLAALMAVLLLLLGLPASAGEPGPPPHPLHQAGLVVFMGSMLLMYGISAAYHGWPVGPGKRWLQRCDHAAIFLFMAGSFTPFALLGWRLGEGPLPLAGVWLAAVLGMGLKLANRLRRPWLSTGVYLAFGWAMVAVARPAITHLAEPGWHLLLAGGLAYTLGCVFYVLDKRLRFSHLVWHLFVMAGSACHVLALPYTAV